MYDTSPFLPMAYNTNDYYMNYYSPREYFYQTGIEHMKRNILESDYRNYSFINSKIPSTNFQNTIKECHSKYHKRKDFTINSLLGLDAQLYARNTRTELDTGQKPSYDCSQNCVTSQLLDTQLYPSTTTNFSLSTSHEKVCNESTSQVPYQSPVWDEIRNEDACNEQNLAKTKRIRTIFTQEQLERLEEEFQRQQYIVGEQRTHLARSLNLSDNQVKIWYQNRRIKMRKRQFDSKCNTSETPNMLKSRVPDTFKSNFSMNSNPLLLSNNFLN